MNTVCPATLNCTAATLTSSTASTVTVSGAPSYTRLPLPGAVITAVGGTPAKSARGWYCPM